MRNIDSIYLSKFWADYQDLDLTTCAVSIGSTASAVPAASSSAGLSRATQLVQVTSDTDSAPAQGQLLTRTTFTAGVEVHIVKKKYDSQL